MVCLRATHFAAFFARTQHGFLDIELLVSGFGSIGTAINIIATVLMHALPGNDAGEDALLVWAQSGHGRAGDTCPSARLTAAQVMLLVDRYLGGHFFDTQAGAPP